MAASRRKPERKRKIQVNIVSPAISDLPGQRASVVQFPLGVETYMAESDAVWHALIAGEEHGPMGRAQLLAHLRDGVLNGSDLVWRPGLEGWIPLRSISEFWQPPRPPAQKDSSSSERLRRAVEPPPLPAFGAPHEDPVPVQPRAEKFSLWGAASGGLAVSAGLLWMSILTSGGYRLADYAYSPTSNGIAYLIGYLSPAPILFVLIAAIRNAVRHKQLGPSTAHAGQRALVFFGILVAMVGSLKIYADVYFSSPEVISGEAKTDLGKSFISGCVRSQRANAANSGISAARIDSYCNCVANSVVSTLTYQQLGAINAMDHVRQAAEAAAPKCLAAQ
jgi:GYF domain 2